jgi:hypothetical protein
LSFAAKRIASGRGRPGWYTLETEFEPVDGKRLVVTLLCRGGFEGERIDDDPSAEMRAAA